MVWHGCLLCLLAANPAFQWGHVIVIVVLVCCRVVLVCCRVGSPGRLWLRVQNQTLGPGYGPFNARVYTVYWCHLFFFFSTGW